MITYMCFERTQGHSSECVTASTALQNVTIYWLSHSHRSLWGLGLDPRPTDRLLCLRCFLILFYLFVHAQLKIDNDQFLHHFQFFFPNTLPVNTGQSKHQSNLIFPLHFDTGTCSVEFKNESISVQTECWFLNVVWRLQWLLFLVWIIRFLHVASFNRM